MLAFASPRRQNKGGRGVHLHVVFLHPSSFVSPALTPPTPHLPLCWATIRSAGSALEEAFSVNGLTVSAGWLGAGEE